METVQFYKDLGLEFVRGDVLGDANLFEGLPKYINELTMYEETPVSGFAWRELKGNRYIPFNGRIEAKSVLNSVSDITGMVEAGPHYTHWRPIIVQKSELSFDKERLAGNIYDADDTDAGPEPTLSYNVEPTYTQAMKDAGEPPKVGMLVDVVNFGNNDSGIVEFISEQYLIVNRNGVEQHYFPNRITFHPPRAQAELVDGEAYSFKPKGNTRGKGFYVDYRDAFYTGDDYTPAKYCTNIQRLYTLEEAKQELSK